MSVPPLCSVYAPLTDTARLVPLRLRRRRLVVGIAGGVHQLAHIRHRRSQYLVRQRARVESAERLLLVRLPFSPHPLPPDVSSRAAAASTHFRASISASTSKSPAVSMPMLSTSVASGTVSSLCLRALLNTPDRHEATAEIWQETYVSALLRAILYSDDPTYQLDAYRKLDPITSPDAEIRFLQAAESVFLKGLFFHSVFTQSVDGVMKAGRLDQILKSRSPRSSRIISLLG